MGVTERGGPVVDETEIRFELREHSGLTDVALLHELRRPRRLWFSRDGPRAPWRLAIPRPDADRLEYLLELTHPGGDTEVVPDPDNPLRAPGPFGDKSVVELPGYERPEWIDDEEAAPGTLRPLRLESRRLRTELDGLLWSASETDPAEPLPLLVVHDGPEYAEYSSLLRLLDHLVDFGEVPLMRAALIPPPADRNDAYSASARYANALAAEVVPALRSEAPHDRPPVLMGASLGALAALHAHWRNPGLASGLFLQSGSFFRRRFDSHEAGFGRFGRITRFVGQIHGGRGFLAPVPTTITCGFAEENL